MGQSFHQPPLPPLHWDEFYWEGEFVLSAWAGFQERNTPYARPPAKQAASGSAHLRIPTSGTGPQAPVRAQIAAFEHLTAAQIPLRDAMLSAILRLYPEWQENYGYDALERRELMPDIRHADDLKVLMELSTVHILKTECEGLAYVGFSFGCTWDDEHGLGALTHGGRVVEVGQADTAFLEWLAERDCQPKTSD